MKGIDRMAGKFSKPRAPHPLPPTWLTRALHLAAGFRVHYVGLPCARPWHLRVQDVMESSPDCRMTEYAIRDRGVRRATGTRD